METIIHRPDPEEDPESSSDSSANAASDTQEENQPAAQDSQGTAGQDTDQFILADLAPESVPPAEPVAEPQTSEDAGHEELFTVFDEAQDPDVSSDTPTGEFTPPQNAPVELTPEIFKADDYPLPEEAASAAAVYPVPEQIPPAEEYVPPAASLPPLEPAVQPPASAAQAYPLPPAQAAYTPPYTPPQAAGMRPPKDRALAIIAEALPGLFGFLGIGWLYAGNTAAGLIVLIVFLGWNFVAIFLDLITAGIFLCIHIPVNLVAVLVSSFLLYNTTKKHPELFGR